MRDFSQGHEWLSINTATVRKSKGQDLPLPQIIELCARKGIRAISMFGISRFCVDERVHGSNQ